MAQYPLQFPSFVRMRYPDRWRSFWEAEGCKPSAYYVALAGDGEIAGHTGFIYNDEVGLYEIVGVVVSKEHARQGIGRALIDHVCRDIREQDAAKVMLYTLGHADTGPTLRFYRDLGFETAAWEKDYFAPAFDRVTFVKTLRKEY
ncbi:GNAT family N-acetyltransferase [Paenibacillus sp. MBLB4367]|uniref:GNAT family N-acetyltransferase n=1 Tax=Paenibacillus sp. MBLB4367 TaxID=3384767 RepID=UPI0039081082